MGRWRIIGLTSLADSSGNGHHSKVVSNVVFGAGGLVGSAGAFSNAYATLDLQLNPTNDFSIEALVRFDLPGGVHALVSQQNGLGTGRSVLYRTDTGELNSNLGGSAALTGHATTTGRWYHVVLTSDANGGTNNLCLYIDGQLEETNSVTNEAATGDWVLGAGKTYFNWLIGLLDEVAVYDKVLETNRVATHWIASNPSRYEDSDGDWLSDYIEVNVTGTDPMDADTDDDGLNDIELPSVAAWGRSFDGQTTVPAHVTNAVAVAGGDYHSLALLADGTVAAWGRNDYGQCNVPAHVTNVVAVAGGAYHSPALLVDGSVAAWGYNGDGQCDVPAHVTNAVAVAGGTYHSLALSMRGDPLDPDMDDDGLLDGAEVNTHGTDPLNPDSDGDGLGDRDEIITHGTDPLLDESNAFAYGRFSVTSTPSAYDLYTSNTIMDLSMGHMMIQATGGMVRLDLQLEQTEDLTSGIWSNVPDGAVVWTNPAPAGKMFYRVRGE